MGCVAGLGVRPGVAEASDSVARSGLRPVREDRSERDGEFWDASTTEEVASSSRVDVGVDRLLRASCLSPLLFP